MKKIILLTLLTALSWLLVFPALSAAEPPQGKGTPRWVIDDVFLSDIIPFAIGHRGYGVNLGEIPDKPIENTTKAVRRAFREGIQIIEVDAVLTGDHVAVALHDDYLPDLTCVNTLTFEELRARLGDVSSLRHILQVSRTYSNAKRSDRPSGQVVVEIKTPSPLCVPLEQEPVNLLNLVEAVLSDIRFTRMSEQVTIESFSPEILALVAGYEPGIPRMLAVDMLQLLPPEWIIANTDLKVRVIDKDFLGLPWGEIGIEPAPGYPVIWLYRLPGYYAQAPGEDAIMNYIMTLFNTGSRTASLDKGILFMLEDLQAGAASDLVSTLHYYGFFVFVFTIGDEFEWLFVSSAGADGMYVDDIPMGLMMEGE